MSSKKRRRKRVRPIKKRSPFESKGVKIGIITIFIAIIAVATVILYNGSNGSGDENSKFIGTWERTDTTHELYGTPETPELIITFFADGNVSTTTSTLETLSNNSGTYEVKDGKLFVKLEGQDTNVFDYSFSNFDRTMTLISTTTGHIHDYIKQ